MNDHTLELLLDAYIELVGKWSSTEIGENKARIWKASVFIERLIKHEIGIGNSRKSK